MILVDANILIYASTPCPWHDKAAAWLDHQITEGPRVGLPWECLTAFLRIVTNPRVYSGKAVSVETAWERIEAWLACPTVWVPVPTERHAASLKRVLGTASRGGNLIPDAQIAALAIEHGLTLCTSDAGFARFPGLKRMNPLA